MVKPTGDLVGVNPHGWSQEQVSLYYLPSHVYVHTLVTKSWLE